MIDSGAAGTADTTDTADAAAPESARRAAWRTWLRSPVLLALLVFGASLLIIGACSYRDPNVYDEGVAVYGAERVLGGEVPYRDFWTLYAPAHLYLLAGLFDLFGTHLIVERHAWVLLQAMLGLLIFLIARRMARTAWALVCWGIAIIWLTRVPLFGAPIRPAMLLCAGALLAVLIAFDRLERPDAVDPDAKAPRRRAIASLALAGALTGLCTLFRQDIGFYTSLAIGATLACSPRPWMRIGWTRVRAVALFGATAAAVILPALLALLAVVPAGALLEQLVTFPVFIYPRVRALPLPAWPESPLGLLRGEVTAFDYFKAHARGWQWYPAVFLLAAATLGSLVALLRRDAAQAHDLARQHDRIRHHDQDHLRGRSYASRGEHSRRPITSERTAFVRALFLIAFTGLLTLNYARVQSDIFHLLPSLLFALIAGVSLLSRTARWRVRWPHALLLTGAVTALAGAALLTVQTERKIRARQSPLDTPRTSGMTTPRKTPGYAQLVAWLQRTVPPDAAFFVGSQQHDAIGINDVMLYFLAARRSATRYHELHPGVATTIPVQEEIVRELDAARVDVIVLRDDTRPATSPQEARSGLTGATGLDRYIATHFAPGPRFDEYQVWLREPASN